MISNALDTFFPTMGAEYANAAIAVGAALVLTGAALGQKGMKALGVLLGSAGAMAAIAGLSSQWLAWFPSDRMAAEASAAFCAMQRKKDLEAACLLQMPKKYLACGVPEKELKNGEHYILEIVENKGEIPQCQFTAKDQFIEECNEHVNSIRWKRELAGVLSGKPVQKMCLEKQSSEKLKELCIKEFAEECGLDPNSLKGEDFDHIDPEVSEEIPDYLKCNLFPNDELTRKCSQRKECVEHYTKDFRTHLDKDMPLLQKGKDFSDFNVKGKSCTLEYTSKMRDSLNLLECIKKFKSKALPGCKDRFLDLKKYISVTGNECRLNMPSEVFESFKSECRKPAS